MSLREKLQRLIERPIRAKFKSALSSSRGDATLLGLLGKLLSQPGLAERVYGEGEIFLIKSGLFMSGVRLEESARQGVGTQWKEDLGQRHYDPDAGAAKGLVPHALLMPHGYSMPLSFNSSSPFALRRERGILYLYLDELRLFAVELEPRPAYYAKTTSTGVPMRHIGVHRLERQVLVEYNAYCHLFSQRLACVFCGIVADRALLPGRHERFFSASPREVAEVVEAAYSEGVCREMQVTGGILPGQAEVAYILEVGRAIKGTLGVTTIPGSQAVLAPPPRLEEIDALKEAGWQGVAFNLEIWDEKLWPGMVPGKAALMPRERWLASLEHAARVFGKGQVASVLVAGLEPERSLLAGIEWLAERGIYGVPIPWTPAPGSALEGHQTPTAAWHLEATVKTLDIWDRFGLDTERHSSGGLHYADLGRMRRHLAEDARRRPDRPLTDDLRFVLAVEGKLPSGI